MNVLADDLEYQEYQPGDWLRNSYSNDQLGFLPPQGGGGGGFPLPGVDPVSAIVGSVTGIIGGLIGGAKQRASDEARSGVALQASIDGIAYLRQSVEAGDITKKEARDAFYLQILPAFLQFISTLTTKSVVESRLENQRRDLINLYEKSVSTLPDAPPKPSPQTAATSDQDLGYTEYYDDQGGYYYEDQNGWYYEDSAGNYQIGDEDGNLYAGNATTGEYWETVNGETYWEAGDGSFYEEYSDGSWDSGDALGNNCSGDAAGNWTCEDGSSGEDWRQSPARVPKQQGGTRRQQQISKQSNFEKYLKQAVALIPKQQRMANNQQRAVTASGSRQQTNAQERLNTAIPKRAGGPTSGMSNLLVLGAVGLGAYFLLNNR